MSLEKSFERRAICLCNWTEEEKKGKTEREKPMGGENTRGFCNCLFVASYSRSDFAICHVEIIWLMNNAWQRAALHAGAMLYTV